MSLINNTFLPYGIDIVTLIPIGQVNEEDTIMWMANKDKNYSIS